MQFDLEKSNQGEWFTYFNIKTDDDGENKRYIFSKDGDKFCLRKPDQDLFDRINRECQTEKSEWIYSKKTRQMEHHTYFLRQTEEQKKKQYQLMADWTFADWNIQDDKSVKIPLTIENKIKMMKLKNADVDMDAFVAECLKIKSEAEAREKEELGKNS